MKGLTPCPLTRRRSLAGSVAVAALTLASRSPRADGHGNRQIKTWRQYAGGGWGQIHLWMAEPVSGPGQRTPLVCLHQSPTSGAYYKEFQAVMAQDRLVISPDTPGYGGSTPPPAQPDMEDYGRGLVEAMNDLGYGDSKPIDVLGFHTGNFVALEMVRQQPGLIRKLVMPGIPYYPPEERATRLGQYANPRPYFTDRDYMRRSYASSVYDREGDVPKERRLEMFTERLRSGTKSHYGFDAVSRYNPNPVLKSLEHPVLLPILNETLAEPTRQAGKMIPNAEQIELMGLDNQVWFVAPDALAEVVRPWLDAEA